MLSGSFSPTPYFPVFVRIVYFSNMTYSSTLPSQLTSLYYRVLWFATATVSLYCCARVCIPHRWNTICILLLSCKCRDTFILVLSGLLKTVIFSGNLNEIFSCTNYLQRDNSMWCFYFSRFCTLLHWASLCMLVTQPFLNSMSSHSRPEFIPVIKSSGIYPLN